MNSYTQPPLTQFEQKLRDEVIYLHSLWHQGPPRNPSNPNPYFLKPTPVLHNYPNSSRNLHSLNHPPFKKTIRHKPKNPNRSSKHINGDNSLPDPGREWPVKSPPPAISGWPASQTNSGPSTRHVSDLDHSKIMQQKVVKRCNEFFRAGSVGGDESDGIDEDDEGDGNFDDGCGIEESEEYKFFFGSFMENQKLREHYVQSHETGDFVCLVCGGIGEKVGKTFKGCVALVHHALAISKTRRKRAHRAFGQVICRVLGWDVGRLPMIVLTGEPFSQPSWNSVQAYQHHPAEHKGKEISEHLDSGLQNVEASLECKESEPPEISGMQWPYEEPAEEVPSAMVGWPTLKPQTTTMLNPGSTEELARVANVQLEQKSLESCRKFFANSSGSDCDQDDDDDNEDDDMYEDGPEEREEYKFFLNLFTEDDELRKYYEDQCQGGEFCCLVCAAIGKKSWKRFKGCVGLLQHAIGISKTKKKSAHGAFGHVICKVLGWDVDRLPAIVLKGDPLSHSLSKKRTLQGEPKENADCNNEDPNFTKNNTESPCVNSELASKQESVVDQKNDELMVGKNPTHEGGTSHINDLDKANTGADGAGAMDSKLRHPRNLMNPKAHGSYIPRNAVLAKTKWREGGSNYKWKNIDFWVKNYCWPEERLYQSKITKVSGNKNGTVKVNDANGGV